VWGSRWRGALSRGLLDGGPGCSTRAKGAPDFRRKSDLPTPEDAETIAWRELDSGPMGPHRMRNHDTSPGPL